MILCFGRRGGRRCLGNAFYRCVTIQPRDMFTHMNYFGMAPPDIFAM